MVVVGEVQVDLHLAVVLQAAAPTAVSVLLLAEASAPAEVGSAEATAAEAEDAASLVPALSKRWTDSDDVRRITSTGYIGEKRAQIIIIARRGDDRSLSYLARIEE